MRKVSEDFMESFSSHGGGCVRQCVCGITHFVANPSGWDWEEGEHESLVAKSTAQPMQYLACDHTPSTYEIFGNEIVMGCPCESGVKHEQFLMEHAKQVADYLNKRAAKYRKVADEIEVKQ
jgi:hypothetical protein